VTGAPPYVIRPKPAVETAALARIGGAVVKHADLTALLYLQGYPRSEFS
jgi:hypothetical protein